MKKYLKILFVFLLLVFVLDLVFMFYSLYQASFLLEKTFTEDIVIENEKEKIRVLFVGDSLAAGVGASSLEKSAYGRFASYLSENYSVSFSNKARSGNKMENLDMNIKEKYDLIVMIISSNDLLYFTSQENFKENTKKVFENYSDATDKLIVLGPGRLFETKAIIKPLLPLYKYRSSIYAKALSDIASEYDNIIHVNPLLDHFSKDYGKMEARDNFHPNDSGHHYWFDLIVLRWGKDLN